MSGPDGEKSSLDRLEGYREALKENKITDFEKIVYGNFETISGYEAINELIKRVVLLMPFLVLMTQWHLVLLEHVLTQAYKYQKK